MCFSSGAIANVWKIYRTIYCYGQQFFVVKYYGMLGISFMTKESVIFHLLCCLLVPNWDRTGVL